MLCNGPQTNHLGPYTLTRLLEKKLVASKARVVTVASVTHRTTILKDARAFLTDWRSGFYQYSKRALPSYIPGRGWGKQGSGAPLGVVRWLLCIMWQMPYSAPLCVSYPKASGSSHRRSIGSLLRGNRLQSRARMLCWERPWCTSPPHATHRGSSGGPSNPLS